MTNSSKSIITVTLLVLLLIPFLAVTLSTLDDFRYKIKGSDGNRWAHLTGEGKVVRGDDARGKIALTFDDGPDHRTTPIILDQLDKYGIKGTFFVNGHRFHKNTAGFKENQAVLRDLYRRGHYVGNHTFSHADVTTLETPAQWRSEVNYVDRQVADIIGRRTFLFRPPFGNMTTDNIKQLKQDGYTPVLWNMDPLDWRCHTPGQLLERTRKVVEAYPEGGVLLFHDTNRNTAASLAVILEWLHQRNIHLRAQGKPMLRFVSLDNFI